MGDRDCRRTVDRHLGRGAGWDSVIKSERPKPTASAQLRQPNRTRKRTNHARAQGRWPHRSRGLRAREAAEVSELLHACRQEWIDLWPQAAGFRPARSAGDCCDCFPLEERRLPLLCRGELSEEGCRRRCCRSIRRLPGRATGVDVSRNDRCRNRVLRGHPGRAPRLRLRRGLVTLRVGTGARSPCARPQRLLM